ncbi:MAG TPA: O-antigen ligase family protein [Bryobacteraceae bacterium]|nr:O-antigen ligase family protein [Bryobacteraceae bacterium]
MRLLLSVADMALLQALTIALAALIIAPGSLFYYDVTPKIAVLLAGTALCLGWAALSGIRAPRKSRLFAAFSLLLIWNAISLAISTAVSSRPALSLFGANWRRYGTIVQIALFLFAWLIAANCAGRPERVRTLLRGVTIAGAVSALYGIAQYFGWDPWLPAAAYHVGEGSTMIVRPPGTLGYASYFATWLLFVVFLSLGLNEMEESTFWRYAARATAPMAGCAMLLTGTRAAILGLVAGGVVWMAIRRVRIPRAVVVATAAAVVGGVGFYFSPPGQQMRSRTRWFVEDPWGGARLDLWRDSLHMAAGRLGAGYGPEVFTAEFPRFESVKLARSYPDFAHESPHNIFVDALVAQGLPGAAALVALCAMGLAAAYRLKLPAFGSALAAGLVSQQFTAFIAPTALLLFVSIALLVASGTPAVPPRRRVGPGIAAAALALASGYFAIRMLTVDRVLESAKQALETGDLPHATSEYQAYLGARLPGGTADLWFSRALLEWASHASSPQDRVAAVRRAGIVGFEATRSAEDPFNAWYNLAVICGSQEQGACVERSLRSAIAAHPTWFKPHWTLAQVLRLQGRMEESLREAVLAVELDAGKNAEVGRTLDEIRAQLARAAAR